MKANNIHEGDIGELGGLVRQIFNRLTDQPDNETAIAATGLLMSRKFTAPEPPQLDWDAPLPEWPTWDYSVPEVEPEAVPC